MIEKTILWTLEASGVETFADRTIFSSGVHLTPVRIGDKYYFIVTGLVLESYKDGYMCVICRLEFYQPAYFYIEIDWKGGYYVKSFGAKCEY